MHARTHYAIDKVRTYRHTHPSLFSSHLEIIAHVGNGLLFIIARDQIRQFVSILCLFRFDIHHIDASKEIVAVAHDLLIGPLEKEPQVVRSAGGEWMQLNRLLSIDKMNHLGSRGCGRLRERERERERREREGGGDVMWVVDSISYLRL